MTARVNKRAAARRAVDAGLADELAQAEKRGAETVRERLRAVTAEHTRVVRVGEQQVEVVEVAALAPILEGH